MGPGCVDFSTQLQIREHVPGRIQQVNKYKGYNNEGTAARPAEKLNVCSSTSTKESVRTDQQDNGEVKKLLGNSHIQT